MIDLMSDNSSRYKAMRRRVSGFLGVVFPSDQVSEQKRFVVRSTLIGLIVATVIVPLVFFGVWAGNGKTVDFKGHTQTTMWTKLTVIIGGVLLLGLGWPFYVYLKGRNRSDENE